MLQYIQKQIVGSSTSKALHSIAVPQAYQKEGFRLLQYPTSSLLCHCSPLHYVILKSAIIRQFC